MNGRFVSPDDFDFGNESQSSTSSTVSKASNASVDVPMSIVLHWPPSTRLTKQLDLLTNVDEPFIRAPVVQVVFPTFYDYYVKGFPTGLYGCVTLRQAMHMVAQTGHEAMIRCFRRDPALFCVQDERSAGQCVVKCTVLGLRLVRGNVLIVQVHRAK